MLGVLLSSHKQVPSLRQACLHIKPTLLRTLILLSTLSLLSMLRLLSSLKAKQKVAEEQRHPLGLRRSSIHHRSTSMMKLQNSKMSWRKRLVHPKQAQQLMVR